jgi:hypothetical protein
MTAGAPTVFELAKADDMILLGGPDRAPAASVERNLMGYDMARMINYVSQHNGKLELTRKELDVFRAGSLRDFVREWRPPCELLLEALRTSARNAQPRMGRLDLSTRNLALARAQDAFERNDKSYQRDFCDISGISQSLDTVESLETMAILTEILVALRVTGGELIAQKRLAAIAGADNWLHYLRTLIHTKKQEHNDPDPMVLNGKPIKSLDQPIHQTMARHGINEDEAAEVVRFTRGLMARPWFSFDWERLWRDAERLGVSSELLDWINGATIAQMGEARYRRLRRELRQIPWLGRGAYDLLHDPHSNFDPDRNKPTTAPSLAPQPDSYYGTPYRRPFLESFPHYRPRNRNKR